MCIYHSFVTFFAKKKKKHRVQLWWNATSEVSVSLVKDNPNFHRRRGVGWGVTNRKGSIGICQPISWANSVEQIWDMRLIDTPPDDHQSSKQLNDPEFCNQCTHYTRFFTITYSFRIAMWFDLSMALWTMAPPGEMWSRLLAGGATCLAVAAPEALDSSR